MAIPFGYSPSQRFRGSGGRDERKGEGEKEGKGTSRFVGQSIQYRTNMRTKVTLSNVSKQIPVQ